MFELRCQTGSNIGEGELKIHGAVWDFKCSCYIIMNCIENAFIGSQISFKIDKVMVYLHVTRTKQGNG